MSDLIEDISPGLYERLITYEHHVIDMKNFTRNAISEYFNDYLDNNMYFTTKLITGDFLNAQGFHIYKRGCALDKKLKSLKDTLARAFRPLINRALSSGMIIKDGRYRFKRTYKI